jgi:hypothetical protein
MQKIDLYQPILHDRQGVPPLTIRVGVYANDGFVEGGTPSTHLKPETYVLLSALPQELRERVTTAIQTIIAGM